MGMGLSSWNQQMEVEVRFLQLWSFDGSGIIRASAQLAVHLEFGSGTKVYSGFGVNS